MLELDKNNLANYLYQNTQLFSSPENIDVQELFGGSDPDAQGYANYIFRARQNGESYIVKQSRTQLRLLESGKYFPPERNFAEYSTFCLRRGITEDYVPTMYFVDKTNHVLVMEDLIDSGLRLMRYELNEGISFPQFPRQIGIFMAKNHFYTSDFYLDTAVFEELKSTFFNEAMRTVMLGQVMQKTQTTIPSAILALGNALWENPPFRLGLLEMRDIMENKRQCYVHGDLHTSNLFVSKDQMRVTDMECSFISSFSYDLGFLLAHFLSQFAAFAYKNNSSYQQYLLDSIENILLEYFACFRQCFDKDAKTGYSDKQDYLDTVLFPDIMRESVGIMAAANYYRILHPVPYADFDSLQNDGLAFVAKSLSIFIDRYLMINRNYIHSPRILVEYIQYAQGMFKN